LVPTSRPALPCCLQSLATKTIITAADVLLFSRQDVQVVIFALATIYNMWCFMVEVRGVRTHGKSLETWRWRACQEPERVVCAYAKS